MSALRRGNLFFVWPSPEKQRIADQNTQALGDRGFAFVDHEDKVCIAIRCLQQGIELSPDATFKMKEE
jgi:hypothetical protein